MLSVRNLVILVIYSVASSKQSSQFGETSFLDTAKSALNVSLHLDNQQKVYYPIHLDWINVISDGYTFKVNEIEVTRYKSLIDSLLQQEITPIVTLFSGNLPATFQPLGGWTNPIMISYFAHYSRQAFKIFGDRVKMWVTFDNPRKICETFQGLKGSEFPLGVGEYACAHNILRAHAEAYDIYNKGFRDVQKGRISIAFDITWAEPKDSTNYKDVLEAEQKMHFEFGLYANPVLNFDYPRIVINRIAKRSQMEGFSRTRLPEFTHAEKLKISQTCDFLKISYRRNILVGISQNEHIGKPSVKLDSGGIEEQSRITRNQILFGQVIKWIQNNYGILDVVIQSGPKIYDYSF